MDWLQFFAAIIGSIASLAWPAALVACVAIFRRELKQLLPMLKLKHGETEVGFIASLAEKAVVEIAAEPGPVPAPSPTIDTSSADTAEKPVEVDRPQDQYEIAHTDRKLTAAPNKTKRHVSPYVSAFLRFGKLRLRMIGIAKANDIAIEDIDRRNIRLSIIGLRLADRLLIDQRYVGILSYLDEIHSNIAHGKELSSEELDRVLNLIDAVDEAIGAVPTI